MINLDLWLAFLWCQDIAKNLTMDEFAQNLKNGLDIYEHVLYTFSFSEINIDCLHTVP